jgi:hypothetical protein
MRPIWLQLDNETDRAYWDFEVYRDMGPGRSIRKAGKRLAKNSKSLAKLSVKYHWRERVRAFDAYVAQRKAEAVVGDAVEMHRRDVETAMLIKNIARVTLAELLWRLNNTDFLNYNSISTAQLFESAPKYSKLYMEGADIERVVRGFKEKGTEDRSTTIDVKSLLNNPEFVRFVETLTHKRMRKSRKGKSPMKHKQVRRFRHPAQSYEEEQVLSRDKYLWSRIRKLILDRRTQ